METYEKFSVTRIRGDKKEIFDDDVVTEAPLTIFLNGSEFVTIICTPEYIHELVLGYLHSERLIRDKNDIVSSVIDEERNIAQLDIAQEDGSAPGLQLKRFITPGCFFYTTTNLGAEKINSKLTILSSKLLALTREVATHSGLYKITGGVHSAALCDQSGVLLFREDVGRHNAVDKIIGHCLLKGMSVEDKILITSGRISSAVMVKIINARIPIIVSYSAPTTESIKLSDNFGITLVGFARGKRINVYTNGQRILESEMSGNPSV
jgi:FdhD protein